MEFMKHKHEDCANFDNGTCRFFHFTNLEPKGSACPHFKTKAKEKKAEAKTVLQNSTDAARIEQNKASGT